MNIYFRAKHLINNLMKKGKDDKNDILVHLKTYIAVIKIL